MALPTLGSAAVYTFTVPIPGSYIVKAAVNAENDSENSAFVNIDSELSQPLMIWDIVPLTTANTFEERIVSWRGNGGYDSDEFVPKFFPLMPARTD
jgi:hypothetical protein